MKRHPDYSYKTTWRADRKMASALEAAFRQLPPRACRPSVSASEAGYMAITAALVILVLMTIASVSAIQFANTEVSTAGNYSVYQRNFYLAEGAAMEAVDILDKTAEIRSAGLTWFDPLTASITPETLDDYWPQGESAISHEAAVDPHSRYVAGIDGIAPGSSMAMDRTKIRVLSVYGRCNWNGEAVIRLGYLAPY